MPDKTMEILIRATDQASPVFERVAKSAQSAGGTIKSAGDIADISPVKKFGKRAEDVARAVDTSEITGRADEARTAAAVQLRNTFKGINQELEAGNASSLRASKLEADKLKAVEQYQKALKAANDEESAALAKHEQTAGVIRGAALASGILGAVHATAILADAFENAREKMRDGLIRGANEFVVEMGKGIPILGTIIQDVEHIADVVAGTHVSQDTLDYMARNHQAAAEQSRQAREGLNNARDEAGKTADRFVGINDDERQRADRQLATDLAEIRKRRDALAEARRVAHQQGHDETVEQQRKEDQALLAAETAARDRRNSVIRGLDNQEQERVAQIQREHEQTVAQNEAEITRIQADARVQRLKDEGRDGEAEVEQIRASTAAQIEAINQRQKALVDSGNYTQNDIADFDRQRGAVAAAGQQQEEQAKQKAARDNAQRVLDITRDTLQAEADHGDRAAKNELKRLEIVEKYKKRQEEIDRLLKDQTLTQDQRNALLAARGGLGDSLSGELADIGKSTPTTVRGSQSLAGLVDARSLALGAYAQSRNVETVGDVAAKATAEHTRQMATTMSNLKTTVDRMQQSLQSLPSI